MKYLKYQGLIKNGGLSKLFYFYDRHKEQIHHQLLERLKKEPRTSYLRHVLETSEGLQRSQLAIDAFGKALSGELDFFFKYQENVGHSRALEGYKLKDILVFIGALKEVLCQLINGFNKSKYTRDLLDVNDVFLLNYILDYAYIILSHSFIETRDEIIRYRRNQLRELQIFAAKVVSIFKKEDILDYLSQAIFDLFGLYGSFLSLNGAKPNINGRNKENIIEIRNLKDLPERVVFTVWQSCQALAIDSKDNNLRFSPDLEEDFFKFICLPILDRNNRKLGLLLIHKSGDVFKLEKFDKNLLYQFSYFTEAVLANCLMVQEIAEKQKKLRGLTGRLISIQEEERKRIAADIHDTITQALTGIGYKALLCQRLITGGSKRLNNELNYLINNINQALRQSRQIIGNLRPKILDDIGFIAALKNLLVHFHQAEKIKIKFLCPRRKANIPAQVGINLFRILQEALHNIKKHSQATRVNVSVILNPNRNISLIIQDDGRGFNIYQEQTSKSGLGLLIMNERAEDLGGNLEINSRPGKGCRLLVKVPIKWSGENVAD